MKNKSKIKQLALLVAIVSNLSFGNDLVSGALVSAHDNYLKANYREAVLQIKSLFQSEKATDLEKKNGLELMSKINHVQNGRDIPVDWRLPSEIKRMKLSVRRRLGPGGVMYGFHMTGLLEKEGIISQLQLVQYPDRVILDKQKGLGQWEDEKDTDGPEFSFRNEKTKDVPPDGLYLVNIELTNGKKTNGWVIVNDMISSESPNVHSPTYGESFTTGNPTFRWDDFHSPEYKSYERRVVSALVIKDVENSTKVDELWTIWQSNPIKTETTVGADPDGKGVAKLEKGKYIFFIRYGEGRRFGDLELRRESATVVPFSVR